MKKLICLLSLLVFLSGCLAIVDESSQGRKVKSFIITKDETLDLLERIDNKKVEDKHIIYPRGVK